jgi:hypothetical protein
VIVEIHDNLHDETEGIVTQMYCDTELHIGINEEELTHWNLRYLFFDDKLVLKK